MISSLRYAGKLYAANNQELCFNEGERIRVTFINDLPTSQSLQLVGVPCRQLISRHFISTKISKIIRPYSILEIEIIAIDPMAKAFIRVEAGGVLPINIRVNDQLHPLVA